LTVSNAFPAQDFIWTPDRCKEILYITASSFYPKFLNLFKFKLAVFFNLFPRCRKFCVCIINDKVLGPLHRRCLNQIFVKILKIFLHSVAARTDTWNSKSLNSLFNDEIKNTIQFMSLTVLRLIYHQGCFAENNGTYIMWQC
jgi:hypothetical protein